MGAAHRTAAYQRAAAAVRAAAYANPATKCRRCGLTLAEVRRIHPKATWDCGHPDPGQTGYAPECSHCNRSAGATTGNRARVLHTTQTW